MFDVLLYLLQNRDRLVSKDDLIAAVWGGRIVFDSNVTSRINAARRAIGDSGEDQKLIRTIPRKAFRFVGIVTPEPEGDRLQPAAANTAHGSRELMRPASVKPASVKLSRPTIAVLPFINPSGDPEQEYFSDGISEDIVTALSKLRWFFVIARNSSFVYKGKSVNMRQLSDELGVGYVIEGSVRKSGERVRITAQLNDATSGSQIWAERYDRALLDVFAVQDEITDAVVASIEPQIYAAESVRAKRKPPDSMDAWDLVMRALSHYWRLTRQDHLVSQALLEKATAIDPNYGQALGLLAASHTFSAHMGWADMATATAIAERAAAAAERDRANSRPGAYEVGVEQEPGSGGKESAESTIRNLRGFKVYADKVRGRRRYGLSHLQPRYRAEMSIWSRAHIRMIYLMRWCRFRMASLKTKLTRAAGRSIG